MSEIGTLGLVIVDNGTSKIRTKCPKSENEPNKNVFGFRNQTHFTTEPNQKAPKSEHLDFGHLLYLRYGDIQQKIINIFLNLLKATLLCFTPSHITLYKNKLYFT